MFASSGFVLFKGTCLQNIMKQTDKGGVKFIFVKGKNSQLWLFHTEFQIATHLEGSDLFLASEVIQAVN